MDTYRSKILASGIYHPPKVYTNKDLEKMVETNDEWITERTGIKERRVAEPGIGPSDLAVEASKIAIEKSGINPSEIDCILFTTSSPDMRLPNSASLLQSKLKLKNSCACVDFSAACSGFVYGLSFADAAIKTGLFKNILLIGSEVLSYFVDWKDRSTCVIFGDGCGAVVLGRASDSDDVKSEVLSSILTADGDHGHLILLDTGGPYRPITEEILRDRKQYVSMQGPETFKIAVKTLSLNCQKALEKANLTIDQIDWVIPHQANIRIIEALANRLHIPSEKIIVNIQKYGNTSTASIPCAFHEGVNEGKIKRGDLVLMAAFGSGITSGAVVLRY